MLIKLISWSSKLYAAKWQPIFTNTGGWINDFCVNFAFISSSIPKWEKFQKPRVIFVEYGIFVISALQAMLDVWNADPTLHPLMLTQGVV